MRTPQCCYLLPQVDFSSWEIRVGCGVFDTRIVKGVKEMSPPKLKVAGSTPAGHATQLTYNHSEFTEIRSKNVVVRRFPKLLIVAQKRRRIRGKFEGSFFGDLPFGEGAGWFNSNLTPTVAQWAGSVP